MQHEHFMIQFLRLKRIAWLVTLKEQNQKLMPQLKQPKQIKSGIQNGINNC